MSLVFQVLSLGDFDEVTSFAEKQLSLQVADETERVFSSWSAKWRKEALEHYLKLGWSFIVRDEKGKTAGYFIAQPLLFFRGHTQSLWVELIEGDSEATRAALIEVAVKVAREKNLQRALFADGDKLRSELERWKPQKLEEAVVEVKVKG